MIRNNFSYMLVQPFHVHVSEEGEMYSQIDKCVQTLIRNNFMYKYLKYIKVFSR